MKYTTASLLASAGLAHASIQGCTGSSLLDAGNWYCGAVKHILYSNVGHAGQYKQVTNMAADGSCRFADTSFSGAIAPFNEGVCFPVPVARILIERLLTSSSSPCTSAAQPA